MSIQELVLFNDPVHKTSLNDLFTDQNELVLKFKDAILKVGSERLSVIMAYIAVCLSCQELESLGAPFYGDCLSIT